jgi:hypothetical protein
MTRPSFPTTQYRARCTRKQHCHPWCQKCSPHSLERPVPASANTRRPARCSACTTACSGIARSTHPPPESTPTSDSGRSSRMRSRCWCSSTGFRSWRCHTWCFVWCRERSRASQTHGSWAYTSRAWRSTQPNWSDYKSSFDCTDYRMILWVRSEWIRYHCPRIDNSMPKILSTQFLFKKITVKSIDLDWKNSRKKN